MSQRNTECTINPSMVAYWQRAAKDWHSLSNSFRIRKDYKRADLYDILAQKAEDQVVYIEGQLQISGEKTIKAGTHGSRFNMNSRTLITANGKRVQIP